MTAMGDAYNDDTVLAAADLVKRAGAAGFELGYHDGDPVTWYAKAVYYGTKLHVDDQPTPQAAATGLCTRLLTGAACKCGRKVSLRAETPGCLWRLVDRRWVSGCDSPPIEMPDGTRGDMAAIRRAMNERNSGRERRAS